MRLRDDSFFGGIRLFLACVFYLIPVIVLTPLIGWWSILAALGFWVLVSASLYLLAKGLRHGRT